MKLIKGGCIAEMSKLEDKSVDMVLVDPPYGTTRCKWDTPLPLKDMWFQLKRITKPSSPILIMSQTPFDKVVGSSNLKMLRYEWIWIKEQGTGNLNANKMPLKQHENILVFYQKLPLYKPQFTKGKCYKPTITKPGHLGRIYGKGKNNYKLINNSERRYPTSILHFSREFKNRYHPVQKPVALMEYLIKTYTNEKDVVLDFTMGSATTAIACLNTKRNFIGIELDENYFKIGKERVEKHIKILRGEQMNFFS